MTDRWETPEEIATAREALEHRLGWHRPAAWGLLDPTGSVIRSSVRENYLPAVVLATVVGHTDGTASYPLTTAQLAAAITLAEPAEACTELEHPNLHALRHLHAAASSSTTTALAATVVFIAEEDLTTYPPTTYPQTTASTTATSPPSPTTLLAHLHRGRQENPDNTTTLYRPTGPTELSLLRAADFQAWPPRLPDQPIFYPVLTESYAAAIARDWNVPASGSGYVTRFRVATPFARRYPTQTAGGPTHLELWIPADELAEFNRHIVGRIEVLTTFGDAATSAPAPASAEPPRTTPPTQH